MGRVLQAMYSARRFGICSCGRFRTPCYQKVKGKRHG